MKAFACQGKTFIATEETFTPLNIRRGKRFFAMSERSALAQMLWNLKESGDGLSYSKMAARSGGLVAISSLHGVMSGKTKNLTPNTITGISRILGISEARVLAALKDRPMVYDDPLDEVKVLFDGWEEATEEDRVATMDDLRMIAERFQRRRRGRPPANGTGKVKGKK